MIYIIDSSVTQPVLSIAFIALVTLSGLGINIIISKTLKRKYSLLEHFIFGNLIFSFLLISGFIIFGVLNYHIKIFYSLFTYVMIPLGVIGGIEISKRVYSIRNIGSITLPPTTFFMGLIFLTLIVFNGIVIYFHPIFSEYDFLYQFLPISKSILLGNGLNHDYYLGSDIAIRAPPYNQAVDSWIILLFGYGALRTFPIYFCLISALFVYLTAVRISKDTFYGWLAASISILIPASMIVGSRFSLQQDLPFIMFISATIYFLTEVFMTERPRRIHLALLMISISLMALTREVGLVLATSIFFLVPAMKYSLNSSFLRLVFIVLGLSPLYLLTFYDIIRVGFTLTITLRFVVIIATNLILMFVSQGQSYKLRISFLIRNYYFLFLLAIPLIYILVNLVTFGGPYPAISFSSKASETISVYRQIFGFQDPLHVSVKDSIQNIPRLDLLFTAVASGSTLIFFKILGFYQIIREFRKPENVTLISYTVILLIVWSYLLGSGYETAAIRHIAYFVPILAIILTLGMWKTLPHQKIFYYVIVIVSAYYFLHVDIFVLKVNGQFGGFWIDPFTKSIIDSTQFRLAAAIIASIVVIEFLYEKIARKIGSFHLGKFTIVAFAIFLLFHIYSLASSNVEPRPLSISEKDFPAGWENGVSDVINYLNNSERGNVLSIRAPAIPSFNNRTNYDIFNPHTLATLLPILFNSSQSSLEGALNDHRIKYVVYPNEHNSLFSYVENMNRKQNILNLIEADPNFIVIQLPHYNIAKFTNGSSVFNLLSRNITWTEFGETTFTKSNSDMNMRVTTSSHSELFNRVYGKGPLNLDYGKPLVLNIAYVTQSYDGIANFGFEIRNASSGTVLWSSQLANTNGSLKDSSFVLSPNTLSSGELEFRFYVITRMPGDHIFSVSRASLTYT